jgi:hypothetical protein
MLRIAPERQRILLPVLGQHLFAGAAEALAVLLQAGQDHLVALAHMGAAEAADIARAGVVLMRRLRERAGGDQDKGNSIKKSAHREPPQYRAKNLIKNLVKNFVA